jgi:hypothetical protein
MRANHSPDSASPDPEALRAWLLSLLCRSSLLRLKLGIVIVAEVVAAWRTSVQISMAQFHQATHVDLARIRGELNAMEAEGEIYRIRRRGRPVPGDLSRADYFAPNLDAQALAEEEESPTHDGEDTLAPIRGPTQKRPGALARPRAVRCPRRSWAARV